MSFGSTLTFKEVPVNSVFKDEHHFLDWLCEADRIKLLNDATDMSLQVAYRELQIFLGRIDLVCLESKTQDAVVVEAQINEVDYEHVKRLIFYAVEMNSKKAILIAANFSDHIKYFISKINQNYNVKLNISLVKIRTIKDSNGENECQLKSLTYKPNLVVTGKQDWKFDLDEQNKIPEVKKQIYNKSKKLASNNHMIKLIKGILRDYHYPSKEYIEIWWGNTAPSYTFLLTFYLTLRHCPENLYIYSEYPLDDKELFYIAVFCFLTKIVCKTTIIDCSKVPRSKNFEFLLNINDLVRNHDIYQKYLLRNSFWEHFHFEFQKLIGEETVIPVCKISGVNRYIRLTSYPNVKLVVYYNTHTKKYQIDIKIHHEKIMLAENLFHQLLDKKDELESKLAEHCELTWLENKKLRNYKFTITCQWKQKRFNENSQLNNIDVAKDLAIKFATIEKVIAPYISKLEKFVW